MEKRLPFIAAIVSGVITWIATAFFLREYLALTTIVLLVAMPLLRPNAWTLIGGFLTGLAIELFNKGATEQLRVVILMLIVGTGLQLAVVFLPTFVRGLRLPESSLGQNMLFALIGIMLVYGFQFLRCPPLIPKGSQVALSQVYLQLFNCQAREALALASEAFKEYGPEFWNTIGLACLWILIMSPMTWAAFFAAMRQVNFNLLDPGRLLARTFMAFLGLVLIGVLVFLLGGLLCWPFSIIAVIAVPSEIESSLLPGHPLVEALVAILFATYILTTAFGAAWGARWGATRSE